METIKENILKYAAGNQQDNYCRLCFAKAFKLRSVFPYGENPDNDLFHKICDLALVRLNHTEEPDCCICSRCISSLEDFGKFQRQCLDYNRLLLETKEGASQQEASSKTAVSVSIPQIQSDSCSSKEYTNEKDIDYLIASTCSSDTDVENPLKRKNGGVQRKTTTARKKKRRSKQFSVTVENCKQESNDSSDSFTPNESMCENRKSTENLSKVKKKRVQHLAVNKLEESTRNENKKSKDGSTTEFTVYNAGHGTVNIVFSGYRYIKWRHCKNISCVRYTWLCVEPDCMAQIFTRSSAKDQIFWKDRYKTHNHPADHVDELLTAKQTANMNDNSCDEAIDEIIATGRGRHSYTLGKLTNGEEILFCGSHKHRLLLEKKSGTKVYGCTLRSCRAVIYFSKDMDMKVFSGICGTATEKIAESSYRKSLKVLAFEGHYYVHSGRRTENKSLIWYCYLKKSHNCPTIIYATEADEVIGSKHEIKLPHNHGLDAYELKEDEMVVQGLNRTVAVESTTYHIAKNQGGTHFIIFEGIRYTIAYTKTDGTRVCRCMETDICGALIYLVPNATVVKLIGENQHNHPLAEQEKDLADFDYTIETQHVERSGQLFRWHKGNVYKREIRPDSSNSSLYYRCTEKLSGCPAVFTTDDNFSFVKESQEPHNHETPQIEEEQRQLQLATEGTRDYTVDVTGDGYDVLIYKDNQYCHFYNHKNGWRVWRCFSASHCKATLFQNLPDGRIVDADRIQHKHVRYKKCTDEENVTIKEKENTCD